MLDLLTFAQVYWQDVPLPYYHSGWRYGGLLPHPTHAPMKQPGRGFTPWEDFLGELAQDAATCKACRSQFTDLPYHEHEAALEQAEQLAREATWRRYMGGSRATITLAQWMEKVAQLLPASQGPQPTYVIDSLEGCSTYRTPYTKPRRL
jgi:hypothetical protein